MKTALNEALSAVKKDIAGLLNVALVELNCLFLNRAYLVLEKKLHYQSFGALFIAIILLMSCQNNNEIEKEVVGDTITSQPHRPIKSVSVTRDGELLVLDKNGKLLKLAKSHKIDEINLPAGEHVTAVSFHSSSIGWVRARSGSLFFTDTGGSNWSSLDLDETQRHLFEHDVKFEFLNVDYGWLTDRFSIAKTANGGRTWQEVIRTSIYSKRTSVAQPTTTFAVNESVAWIGLTGGGVVKIVGQDTLYADLKLNSDDVSAVFALNDQLCWVGTWNANGLYFTQDGGTTWFELLGDEKRKDLGISSIQFLDKREGWLAGTRLTKDTQVPNELSGFLMRTNDGGKTWHFVEGPFEPISFVRFYGDGTGWLVGDSSILHTVDKGVSWKKVLQID